MRPRSLLLPSLSAPPPVPRADDADGLGDDTDGLGVAHGVEGGLGDGVPR
jgi:hypothetical protein